jgi:hypothetical protein
MANDWKIPLLTIEAMPYLTRLGRAPTDNDYEVALSLGYERLERQLPLDDASDLYCDFDANYNDYMSAVRARFSEIQH